MNKIEDIDYKLPQELIAVKPVVVRDESRLLVISKKEGNFPG